MELHGAKEPFDIEINNIIYAVFPEEEDMFMIYKEGEEYLKIIKDTDTTWLKLDPETELPLFGLDEEVNTIGQRISEIMGT